MRSFQDSVRGSDESSLSIYKYYMWFSPSCNSSSRLLDSWGQVDPPLESAQCRGRAVAGLEVRENNGRPRKRPLWLLAVFPFSWVQMPPSLLHQCTGYEETWVGGKNTFFMGG